MPFKVLKNIPINNNSAPQPRRWHYTTGDCLQQILESECIRPATACVPDGERPAVWTTTSPRWDETANKSYIDDRGVRRSGDRTTTERLGYGLARIEVRPEAAPIDWTTFKATSGIDPRIASGLARTGKRLGSRPTDWFVSYEPIALEDWLSIEVWRSGKWVPFEFGIDKDAAPKALARLTFENGRLRARFEGCAQDVEEGMAAFRRDTADASGTPDSA